MQTTYELIKVTKKSLVFEVNGKKKYLQHFSADFLRAEPYMYFGLDISEDTYHKLQDVLSKPQQSAQDTDEYEVDRIHKVNDEFRFFVFRGKRGKLKYVKKFSRKFLEQFSYCGLNITKRAYAILNTALPPITQKPVPQKIKDNRPYELEKIWYNKEDMKEISCFVLKQRDGKKRKYEARLSVKHLHANPHYYYETPITIKTYMELKEILEPLYVSIL